MKDLTPPILEREITLVAPGIKLSGKLEVSGSCRFHGRLEGEVIASSGSEFTLGESGWIEGSLKGDLVIVQGTVRGDIKGATRVQVTSTGRVLGNIQTPSLQIDAGAHVDGKFTMLKH